MLQEVIKAQLPIGSRKGKPHCLAINVASIHFDPKPWRIPLQLLLQLQLLRQLPKLNVVKENLKDRNKISPLKYV